MSRTDSERIEDIHAAIARCMAYRDRLDSAELGEMAYDAILRNLAVIGEAVKALPDGYKREHPGTPWPCRQPVGAAAGRHRIGEANPPKGPACR